MSGKDLASAQSSRGRYWIHTYGCQMNVHDSEIYAGQLRSLGFLPADGPLDADVILLNTCSVREKAEEKLFSELGRLRTLKDRPPAATAAEILDGDLAHDISAGRQHVRERQVRIGVTGCIAQQRGGAILSRESSVDFVLGTRALRALPSVLDALEAGEGPQVVTDDLVDFDAADADRQDTVKAFVTIMEGCDNYCSFCIVPSTRGMEVYRRARDIEDEVRALSLRGFREITLLGQNVNSWNDSAVGVDFPHLLWRLEEQLDASPEGGVDRIRFLTSHPKDLSPELIDIMAAGSRVAKHIHLPVQSGSDEVLYRMNRHYTASGYLDLVATLRNAVPEIGLSTDLIVGFPGETEADFEATLELVQRAQYDSFFSFEYSPRPDTAATLHEDTVPAETKRRRLVRLQDEQRRIQVRKNSARVGRTVEVLVEGFSRRTQSDVMGRTSSNHVVNFPGDPSLIGHLVAVKIVGSSPNSLYGERVKI